MTVSGATQTSSRQITVKPWTPPTGAISPGSNVTLTFNWTGGLNVPPPKVGGSWAVFVHLENVANKKELAGTAIYPVIPAVNWVGDVSTPTTYTVPANAPAGTYNVIVGLYSGNERLNLDVSSPVRDVGGRRYLVGSFSVTTATNTLTPRITSLNFSYCIKGAYLCRLDIGGNNFSLTGNNVKLTNTVSPFTATSLGINGTNIGNLPSNGIQIVADVDSIPVGKYNLTNTVIVNGVATTSNAVPFEVLPITAVPTITGVSPSSGPLGTVINITGTHFDGNNNVQVGPLLFSNIPPDSVTGQLKVTMPTNTVYNSYSGTPLRISVDNDSYGYSGDNQNATPYTFTITTGTPTDMTAPVISAISSSTGNTFADISWTTNELSDTQVLYGSSNNYGNNTTLNTAMVTSHTANISGLQPNTVYYFSVRSKDASGNLASSTARTFRTKGVDNEPPFAPFGVSASAISSSQINITWSPSSDNVGVTAYRVLRNGVFVATTTTTSYSDTGLTPATTYSYTAQSVDAAGNVSAPSTVPATATTLTITTPPSGTIDTTGGKLIWDGVSYSDKLTCQECLYNGSLVANSYDGMGFRSTSGDFTRIEVNPLSISQKYNKLVFFIKSNQAAGARVSMYFRDGSNVDYITPKDLSLYVAGGKIDTTWRQVVIDTNGLSSPFANKIAFTKSSGTVIEVDSFYLVDTIPNSIETAKPLSNATVMITTLDAYATTTVHALADFTIKSADDTSLLPTTPVQVGRQFYPTDFAGEGLIPDPKSPVMQYNIFLRFNSPAVKMEQGKRYTITATHLRDAEGGDISTPQTITFTYDETGNAGINGSVKANQVGYLPVSKKYAYVGNYMGDALGMALPSGATSCQLIKVGSGAVFTGNLEFRADDPLMSGEKVYSCDFSSYQTNDKTAQYYINVPGVGRSYNFRIASDVYNSVFKTVLKGLYYQRSGTELLGTHAGTWARPAGHVANDSASVIHSTVRTQSDGNLHPLSDSQDVPGTTKNLLKGWYDAGDFGKYIGSASVTINELLTAYDLFPNKFTDNQTNIPESNNTVPDILDEVRWELEWMKNMQSPNGGVYHKVATTNWTQTMPAGDTATMYISEKSTHATLQYAAIMAKAARIYRPFDSAFADDLKARAEKAWAFAEATITKTSPGLQAVSFGWNPPCTYVDDNGVTHLVNCNPPGIGGGENTDRDDAWDERAWAAAELYHLTNTAAYKTAFYKYIRNNPMGDWQIYGGAASQRASFTFAFNPNVKSSTDSADISFLTLFRNGLKGYAADIVNRTLGTGTASNPYRNGSYKGDTEGGRKGNGWGAYSQGSRYSWQLIRSAEVIEQTGLVSDIALAQTYRDAAKVDFDPQLGNNPLNKTYITGVGSNSPMAPLHTISSLDGIAAPVPGIPIYGVHHDYTSYDAVNIGLRPNVYPGDVTKGGTPYPTLRNYWDIRSIVETGEFTILDYGYTAAAYAYFAE